MSIKDEKKVIVYSDGASRGNPGAASVGVVICDSKGGVLKEYGEVLGKRTNNEAEYAAVILGLKKVRQLAGRKNTKKMSVEMRMDSQLIAEQLSGNYRLETEGLFKLFITIWNLKIDFGDVKFVHIPRGENKRADALANEALDSKEQGSLL